MKLFKRSDKELELKAWDLSLGSFLSEWDYDMEPEDVLQAIEDGHDSILVWEPFEGYSAEWLLESIKGHQYAVLADLRWVAGKK
jgi:hypothetical protein